MPRRLRSADKGPEGPRPSPISLPGRAGAPGGLNPLEGDRRDRPGQGERKEHQGFGSETVKEIEITGFPRLNGGRRRRRPGGTSGYPDQQGRDAGGQKDELKKIGPNDRTQSARRPSKPARPPRRPRDPAIRNVQKTSKKRPKAAIWDAARRAIYQTRSPEVR